MKIRGPYNVDCNCHGCAAGRKEVIEICIVYGKWFTYISGSGLFMWQNYYGHGPLNGLTKEERTLLNMKETLAWNKWKTDET